MISFSPQVERHRSPNLPPVRIGCYLSNLNSLWKSMQMNIGTARGQTTTFIFLNRLFTTCTLRHNLLQDAEGDGALASFLDFSLIPHRQRISAKLCCLFCRLHVYRRSRVSRIESSESSESSLRFRFRPPAGPPQRGKNTQIEKPVKPAKSGRPVTLRGAKTRKL